MLVLLANGQNCVWSTDMEYHVSYVEREIKIIEVQRGFFLYL